VRFRFVPKQSRAFAFTMGVHIPPMTHSLRTFAIVAMLCLLSVRTPAQTERIRDFRSDIHLLDDGTLLVKETITVFSTGNLIRHGIYREFPTHYKDHLGNNYVVGFHWLGALCDGYAETSRVEDYSNGLRIYLGDKNAYISRGSILTSSTTLPTGNWDSSTITTSSIGT
jgi:Predicted membrane protein (DUF2207)